MKKQNAFTLIELSLVLVIIGLLVGGVLSGRELIKGARLRSIIADVESMQTAINIFQLKYNALPGDLRNASTMFSGATDGNGNGAFDQASEGDMFDHLFRAGLVVSATPKPKGMATDVYVSITNVDNFGNLGGSPGLLYAKDPFPHWLNSPSLYGILLTTNDPPARTGLGTQGRWPLDGLDALSIDTKMDDGKAISGRVGMYSAYDCTACMGNYMWIGEGSFYYGTTTARACSVAFWGNESVGGVFDQELCP